MPVNLELIVFFATPPPGVKCSADCTADEILLQIEMWVIMTTKCSRLAYRKDDVFGCIKNTFFPSHMAWCTDDTLLSVSHMFSCLSFLALRDLRWSQHCFRKGPTSWTPFYLRHQTAESTTHPVSCVVCYLQNNKAKFKVMLSSTTSRPAQTSLSNRFYCSIHIELVIKLAHRVFLKIRFNLSVVCVLE